MLLKKSKNDAAQGGVGSGMFHRTLSLLCLMIAVMVLVDVLAPAIAHAASGIPAKPIIYGTDGEMCPETGGLSKKFVVCFRGIFLSTVNQLLVPISTYFAKIVSALCVMAIVLMGWAVTGRRSNPLREISVPFLKITCVGIYTNNFGGMFPEILGDMDDMLSAVVSGVSTILQTYAGSMSCPNIMATTGTDDAKNLMIWDYVDCAVGSLIGGVPGFALSDGLISFMGASIFSGSVGVAIALFLVAIILQLLFALARSVYIFITAYMAFSFMVLISPLFITFILFSSTKPYFDKWFRMTIGFILQPLFLFAFLVMLLMAFDKVVFTGDNALMKAIVPGGDTSQISTGAYLNQSGAYAEVVAGSTMYNFNPQAIKKALKIQGGYKTGTFDTITQVQPGTESATTDTTQGTTDATSGMTRKQDWSTDVFESMLEPAKYFKSDVPNICVDFSALAGSGGLTTYLTNLLLSLILAVVTAYIFMTLLEHLPYIGSGISGSGDIISTPSFGVGRLSLFGGK